MPVLLDSCHNKIGFLLIQELEARRLGGKFREVHNRDICAEAKEASEKTLEDACLLSVHHS